jgi:hypothetical protein
MLQLGEKPLDQIALRVSLLLKREKRTALKSAV